MAATDTRAAKTFVARAQQLLAAAGRAGDPEAARLHGLAADMLRMAEAHDPGNVKILELGAFARLRRARRLRGEEARSLLREALEGFQKVEALAPGHGAYNTACAYALLGEEERAMEWLKRAKDAGLTPDASSVSADPDLAVLRGTQWLADFVESLPEEDASS
ncbi:MAG: hypothetical protein GF320_19380 [Armatimonadia bacterium]|nr:hypothetical protein [Armatimonadia bacterium]